MPLKVSDGTDIGVDEYRLATRRLDAIDRLASRVFIENVCTIARKCQCAASGNS